MLLAMVLGFMLAIVGPALVRQWLDGALNEPCEEPRGRPLQPAEFPRLAPPRRIAARATAVRATAVRATTVRASGMRAMPMRRRAA